MSLQHEHQTPHESALKEWLYSRTGAATCIVLMVLGFLIYTRHSAHLLGAVPYLLVLACPLMHLFMHGGHGHRRHQQDEREE